MESECGSHEEEQVWEKERVDLDDFPRHGAQEGALGQDIEKCQVGQESFNYKA